nr:fatty acids and retinol binding protein [Hymenolepis microstoma]
MEGFLGSWKLTSSSGFEKLMERLGLEYVVRKGIIVAKPVVKITELASSPGTYNLKTTNTFRITEVQFRLQEPFLETTLDGRKVKTVVTLDRDDTDGSWVLRQCQVGEKVTDIERRLLDANTMKTVRLSI